MTGNKDCTGRAGDAGTSLVRLPDFAEPEGAWVKMQALSALTPPLLVCAVVVIAILAFLRHEMGRSRTDRSAAGDEGEVPEVQGPPEPDKRQHTLTDAAQASADDSGPVSRPLR